MIESPVDEVTVAKLLQKPHLLMLQGLPGSGKTTMARSLVDTRQAVRVNKDDLREMLHNGIHSKSSEKEVLALRDKIVVDTLSRGRTIIVDDTNFAPYHETRLREIAKNMGIPFVKHFVDTPLEDCLLRNAQRDKPVPESVITDMYEKYLAPKTPVNIPVTIEGEEKDEAIIVDVDGTLAHISGDNPRNPYDASRAMEDTLDDAVSVITAMAYSHGYKVIILTGRTAAHRQATEEWLEANGVEYDELYTRADGDKRQDSIVKEELYRTHVEPRYKVKFVLDDRAQVIRMWESNGLKVLMCGKIDNMEF